MYNICTTYVQPCNICTTIYNNVQHVYNTCATRAQHIHNTYTRRGEKASLGGGGGVAKDLSGTL